ncbi:MAG TPA: hypothetical protein VM490_12415 [Armatimonadaceae bacterium]|nr:hypothetical protein [Armatimonadaceae bacterium]
METLEAIRPALDVVASSLAPSAILISVGLLIAGLQMKYTALVSDLRDLAAARGKDGGEECSPAEGGAGGGDSRARAEACRAQARSLLGRAWLVRCALVWLYGSTLLSLLGSLAVGAAAAMPSLAPLRGGVLLLVLFGASLAAVLVGVGYALAEARRCFDVVAAEVHDLAREGVIDPALLDPKEGRGDAVRP